MTKIVEITRIRFEDGWYIVELRSAATGIWICLSCHRNKQEAEADRKNWM